MLGGVKKALKPEQIVFVFGARELWQNGIQEDEFPLNGEVPNATTPGS
jgi:hypothetical protein